MENKGVSDRIRYSSSTKNVLGEGWIGEEAVASAMYCCWRSPDDYSAAVLTAMNTDGDSDYLHALGKRLWQKCGSRFP